MAPHDPTSVPPKLSRMNPTPEADETVVLVRRSSSNLDNEPLPEKRPARSGSMLKRGWSDRWGWSLLWSGCVIFLVGVFAAGWSARHPWFKPSGDALLDVWERVVVLQNVAVLQTDGHSLLKEAAAAQENEEWPRAWIAYQRAIALGENISEAHQKLNELYERLGWPRPPDGSPSSR